MCVDTFRLSTKVGIGFLMLMTFAQNVGINFVEKTILGGWANE
jgi:hypothetical protein